MSLLFSPITLGKQVFKNRLFVSPMCQYSSEDGFANDWHLVHLGSRAVGGAGLVMQEATAIAPEGRISPDDLGIWKDEHMEKLQQIVSFIHTQNSKAGIQLAHAGRKASTNSPWKGSDFVRPPDGGWQTVAPSALPFYETDEIPHALSVEEILQIVDEFGAAARRARFAGYDVVEIHAAHGYLIHQFLSPLSNHRNDQYGGSFENRIRLLLEIVEAVKAEMVETQSLFVRISATDYLEGGWDLEQSVRLSMILEKHGVHLIDVSSGALSPKAVIKAGPGYQVPFAEAIKKAGLIAVGAVGIIVDAEQAEAILKQEQADVIFMARELLRNPYFPLHAAQQLDGENIYPNQYKRAYRE